MHIYIYKIDESSTLGKWNETKYYAINTILCCIS
jgi:hypothetical protein